ncbi:MAG: hypothetical protein C4318_04380 [Acidimicrobiia bacterium]
MLHPPLEIEPKESALLSEAPRQVGGVTPLPAGERPHFKQMPLVASVGMVLLAIVSIAIRLEMWSHAVIYPYDAYYYMGTARSLALGAGYVWRGQPHTRFLPGYPLTITPFVSSAGPELGGVLAATLAWALLGMLCYYIASRVGGWMAGLAAGIIVLFHPLAIEWTTVPMAEGVFTLAAYGALALMLEALRDKNAKALFFAALPGGFALITRNEGLVLVPLYLACSLWILYHRLKRFSQTSSFSNVYERKVGGRAVSAGLALLLIPYSGWLFWSLKQTSSQISYASELAANLKPGLGNVISGLFYYSWHGYRSLFITLLGYLGFLLLIWKAPYVVALLGSWIASMTVIHAAWYFRYDRFALASVPALGIAAGAAIGAVGSLGARNVTARSVATFRREYLLLGLALTVAGLGAVSIRDGKNLALLHFALLERGGGQAIITASRVGGHLNGNLASNAGALAEFYSERQVVDIVPPLSSEDLAALDPRERPCRAMLACFDPDKIGAGTPEERFEALKTRGVRYLIIQIDNQEPAEVLKALRLPQDRFHIRALVIIQRSLERSTAKAAIFRLE